MSGVAVLTSARRSPGPPRPWRPASRAGRCVSPVDRVGGLLLVSCSVVGLGSSLTRVHRRDHSALHRRGQAPRLAEEALRAGHPAKFRHGFKLGHYRSLEECRDYLILARDLRYTQTDHGVEAIDEISRMLDSYLRAMIGTRAPRPAPGAGSRAGQVTHSENPRPGGSPPLFRGLRSTSAGYGPRSWAP